MTKLDLITVLDSLSKKRPVFTSEADFQLSLGLEIQAKFPKSKIILEYPVIQSNSTIYIDMVVEIEGKKHPIELKYKTKGVSNVKIHDSMINLKNQAAQDLGRYAFLKDIERIEGLKGFSTGFAIMITNDMSYVKKPKSSETIDKDFRIHNENIVRNGCLSWNIQNPQPGHWTLKYSCLNIKNSYKMEWHKYYPNKSQSTVANGLEFMCLICEI